MQCIKAFIIEQVKKTCQIKADLGKNYVKSRQEQWSIKVNYEQQFSRNNYTFIATSRYTNFLVNATFGSWKKSC